MIMESGMDIQRKKSKVKVKDKSKYSLKLILPNPYLIWYHRQQPISLLIIDTEKERQTSSQFVANIRSHCELMLMDGIQKSRIKGSLSRYKFFIRFLCFFLRSKNMVKKLDAGEMQSVVDESHDDIQFQKTQGFSPIGCADSAGPF